MGILFFLLFVILSGIAIYISFESRRIERNKKKIRAEYEAMSPKEKKAHAKKLMEEQEVDFRKKVAEGFYSEKYFDMVEIKNPNQAQIMREKVNKVKLEIEAAITPDERKRRDASKRRFLSDLHGDCITELVCPHCQAKGLVRMKKGQSDELVLKSSHLYRKKDITKMWCGNCTVEWEI